MLPIWQDKLSIDEIILKWSLEMQPPAPSPEELVDFFVSAWWLGKLKGLPPFTTRLALLKAMVESARAGDWNRVVFITPEEAEGVEQSDGSLLITDLERPRVPVPSKDPVTCVHKSTFEAERGAPKQCRSIAPGPANPAKQCRSSSSRRLLGKCSRVVTRMATSS